MKRINDFFADHGFSPYSLGMLVLLCEAIIGIVIVAWIKIVGIKDWRTSIVMGALCVLIFIIDIIFGYICVARLVIGGKLYFGAEDDCLVSIVRNVGWI